VLTEGAQSLNYLFLTSSKSPSKESVDMEPSDEVQEDLLDYDYSLEGDLSSEATDWNPMIDVVPGLPVLDLQDENEETPAPTTALPQPQNRPSVFYSPDASSVVDHPLPQTKSGRSIDIPKPVLLGAVCVLLLLLVWAAWPGNDTEEVGETARVLPEEAAPKVDHELLLETARKFRQGSEDEALVAAKAAAKALPDHWEAQFLLGRALMRNGAWQDAQFALKRAQKLLPERVGPHRSLVEILLEQKLNRAAARAARRALSRHGTDARLYLLLARAELGDRRLREAAEALEMSVQITPGIKGAWHLLGNVRALQGQHKEAMHAFKKALVLEPGIAEAYVGLGRSLMALGEGGDAVAMLAKGLVYAPGAHELRYALGRVLMNEGKIQSAIPHLESFVDAVPDHWQGTFSLGLGYARMGQWDPAKKWFIAARALRPQNAIIEYNLAMVLAQLGEIGQSAKALASAVSLRYSLWEAHCGRARILHRLGRYTDAEASYAEAMKLNSKLVVARSVLAAGIQTGLGHMLQGLPCTNTRFLDIRL
jgi:tetratricopeptide (TPR) repeat protein